MKTIACFGDSLVQGFPFGKEYSWLKTVEKQGKLQMLNYGLCGDCMDDIFMRMKIYPLPKEVEYVLFLGGANDVLQGVPLSFSLDMLDKIIAWCENKQLKLCVLLPWLSSDEGFNRYLIRMRENMKQRLADKVYLLDLQPALGTDLGVLKQAYLDGVHPTVESYEALGRYAEPLLEQWVEE